MYQIGVLPQRHGCWVVWANKSRLFVFGKAAGGAATSVSVTATLPDPPKGTEFSFLLSLARGVVISTTESHLLLLSVTGSIFRVDLGLPPGCKVTHLASAESLNSVWALLSDGGLVLVRLPTLGDDSISATVKVDSFNANLRFW